MWPGQRFSLKVGKVLFEARSALQDILVFDSETYGRVLVLDGVIQLTERDEHAYQEMLTHLPMFAHPSPRSVLIVGGGDGGVLREVARHADVERIVMCEIDELVVRTAKKFFSGSTATAFDDPRLTLVHEDAAAFLKRDTGTFDVIVVDSSDPVGPAETLYEPEFYTTMRDSLTPGGIIATQGECLWLHLPLITRVMSACGPLFATVDYAYTTVPTYPSGQIGFIICSTAPATAEGTSLVRSPSRPIPAGLQQTLKYYNPAVHEAAFVLPQFAEAQIAPVRRPCEQADLQ